MSWKGRILGAIIGLFFGGFGALIGFIVGYLFIDKPKNNLIRLHQAARETFLGRGNQAEHKLLMQSTFRLMGYIARGAGRINEMHIKHAEDIMDAMNMSSEMRKIAIDGFHEGKSDDYDLNSEIDKLRNIVRKNPTILNYIIEILISIAIADGNLEQGEHERLMNLARVLNIDPNIMNRVISTRLAEYRFRKFAEQYRQSNYNNNNNDSYGNQSYENYERFGYDEQEKKEEENNYTPNASANELEQAYEILGVTPETPWNEVRRTHKKLMLKYHPDRLAQQGLPPEMVASFTEKAQSIQAAYNLIKSVRGEK